MRKTWRLAGAALLCTSCGTVDILTGSSGGIAQPTSTDKHKMEAGQEVHQWIAQEAWVYYSTQFSGNEILTYLGTIAGSHNDNDNNILEGTADEDIGGQTPFLTDIPLVWPLGPFMQHYCDGGDGDELYDGIQTHRSACARAIDYWNNYVLPNYPSDKELAYYYLGHVAHLLADMTVPAHVNKDEHINTDTYENTMGADYTRWFVGGGRPSPTGDIPLHGSLEALFRYTTDYTDDYPSDGSILGICPGDVPVEYSHPDPIPDLSDGMQWAEFLDMGDDLMPHAMEQTAALYRYFYMCVDSTPAFVSMDSPSSTNLAFPDLAPTTTVTLEASASDSQSGVDIDGYRFESSYWAGSAWTSWSSVAPSLTTSSVGFTGVDGRTYRFRCKVWNGAGRSGTSPTTYMRIDVPSPPTISRSLLTLTPSCIQGNNASSQFFDVWNSGGGTLAYSITANASWLACSPSSGDSTGEPDTISVSYGTSGLSAGVYSDTITITAGGATNSPRTISVNLTVDPPASSPAIALDTTLLAPSCIQGSDAPAQLFEVWNAGTGTLSYTITANASWLACSPPSGDSTAEHDPISVSYSTSGLTAGTHNDTITIAAGGATNSPRTISVNLTVDPPASSPAIALDTTLLTPSCIEGDNASSQFFEVWNSGGGALAYTITANASWLACSPSTGSSTGGHDTISVSYSTSGLSAGTYNDTITITAGGATNSPQTISVTLTVTASVGGDIYEPDDSFAQAQWMSVGESQFHSIHVIGDRDYVEFYLAESSDVVVMTGGSSGDTMLYLYDFSLSPIATDNNGGSGAFSRISMTGMPSGTYYAMVEEYLNDSAISFYLLSLNATPSGGTGTEDDPNAGVDTATPLGGGCAADARQARGWLGWAFPILLIVLLLSHPRRKRSTGELRG